MYQKAAKLCKFAIRLKKAVGDAHFDLHFPKPLPKSKRPDPTQGALDLFG